ncbi:MAG TPA: flavodoxin domain-containing protein [Chitinophagaceae bacterium]|jgi:sulfite reductase (NADPH) flavoprotein alpha-component|nr:flavodoxin domain-containing protein [Chitinophagaceae bacterium]
MTQFMVKDISRPVRTAREQTPGERLSGPIRVLYGTHTGNSKWLAEQTVEKLQSVGVQSTVLDMGSLNFDELPLTGVLLIIVSTDGDGEPPLMAEEFLEYLNRGQAPLLNQLRYSVLALGDTCYYRFCQAGKDFDTALEHLGAGRICQRVDCDVDFDDDFQRWIETVISVLVEDIQAKSVG